MQILLEGWRDVLRMDRGQNQETPMSHSKLEKLDEQIAQLKARKQAIKARERDRKRKRRTHALVVLGAAARKLVTDFGGEDTKASLLGLVSDKDAEEVEALLDGKLD